MKFAKLVLVAAVSFATLSAQAADLVTNGSFEAISGASVTNGYRKISAGSGDITGWTIGGNSVDIINGAYNAISGNSIDMLGSPGPGTLSQTLSTANGQNYVLSFDLSFNPNASNATKAIGVSFAGGAVTNFTGTVPFSHYTLGFTATSASTSLTFSSTSGADYSGAVLDNVSVTAVPEPETYAMLLAGMGIMGAVVRRRQSRG